MNRIIPLWSEIAPYTQESPEQAQPSVKEFAVPGSRGAFHGCHRAGFGGSDDAEAFGQGGYGIAVAHPHGLLVRGVFQQIRLESAILNLADVGFDGSHVTAGLQLSVEAAYVDALVEVNALQSSRAVFAFLGMAYNTAAVYGNGLMAIAETQHGNAQV